MTSENRDETSRGGVKYIRMDMYLIYKQVVIHVKTSLRDNISGMIRGDMEEWDGRLMKRGDGISSSEAHQQTAKK